MDFDLALLRRAKVPALERLARSLGVNVPAVPVGGYVTRLTRAVLHAIETDRRQAAAETRRAMDEEARRKVAVEMVEIMGEEWVRARMPEAWARFGDVQPPSGLPLHASRGLAERR